MQATYHIRIKKDYAAAVIEDLQKMDAVELMEDKQEYAVPQWQIDFVSKRIEEYKANPDRYIDEETFFKLLDAE